MISFIWLRRMLRKRSLWWRQSVCNIAGPGRTNTASATSSCVGRRPRYSPGLFPAPSSTTIRLSTWLDDPSFTHPHTASPLPSNGSDFFFYRLLEFIYFLCILVMCVYSVGDGPNPNRWNHPWYVPPDWMRCIARLMDCALAIKKPLLTLVALFIFFF
jgi:hypothetical protein